MFTQRDIFSILDCEPYFKHFHASDEYSQEMNKHTLLLLVEF